MIDLMSIPVLGPALEKISDKIVAALFSHLNYVFCSKSLIEDLKSENDKLEIVENLISRKAEQESNSGKILEKHVVDWKKDAKLNQENVGTCLEKYDNRPSGRCIGCVPIPHPGSRYRLGKEAAELAKATTILTTSGNGHLANQIAYLPLDMNVPVTAFQNFESRDEAYKKLEGLVTDDSSSILGIYGIAGAGKTRLMERITTEAGKKGTFHKVVRANVGNEELNVIGIQEQLAGKLGCVFGSKTDAGHRANQLRSSLRQGGKILVILDDIWRVIPLDTIGILSADGMSSVGGKILLTSRSDEVCKRNKCEHLVKIEPLTPAEAWEMFSKTVGAAKIDSLQNISLASDICKRCGGLPLVILAVGNALKFKPLDSWRDARNQLKNSKIERVSGIRGDVDVYACLKLSFDNLEDDAKACLLLASIFPEDADIPIRTLVQLAIGSQLIEGDKIRMCSMIYILKSSSLLLGGIDSEHIKLHDTIRDMARSIAIKDYGFLFARSGSLPDNQAQYSGKKLLLFEVEETHLGFPSDLGCPDLQTLFLRQMVRTGQPTTLQEWVGDGQIFANLIFLALMHFSWPEEFSLKSLGKLKTLWFDDCDLWYFGKSDVKFLPEKLENLCIWNCIMSRKLNLPDLNHLRKLEIDSDYGFSMVPNTISRLSRLEELRLPAVFSVASLPVLDEISTLSRLTSLHIYFRQSKSAKLATIFPDLSAFHLFVGDPSGYYTMNLSSVSVTKSIMLFNQNLVDHYHTLIERAEEVKLFSTNFKGSSLQNIDTKDFIDLRYMYIDDCKVMEYLATVSPQNEIQGSLQQSTPFSNLIRLEIKGCPRLKYLFCNYVAKCLVQLQELEIENCSIMEEVVLGKGTRIGNIINLSKLRKMNLIDLPRLVQFYKNNVPSAQIQPLFDGMVAFPSLEKLKIQGLNDVTDIWGDNNDNASSFPQLKELYVTACNNLKTVIAPALLRSSLHSDVDTHGSNTDSVTSRAVKGHVKTMVSRNPKRKLQNFWKKTVHMCRSVCRRIPKTKEENLNDPSDILDQIPSQNTRVCPLVEMTLWELPCLEITGLNFESQSGEVSSYPNLKTLRICECNNLGNMFIPSPDRQFMNLKYLSVTKCIKMREIIGAGTQKITKDIMFHNLDSLKLTDLPGLTSFWGCPDGEANSHKVKFPNLEKFELSCGKITSLETIDFGTDNSIFRLEKLEISCDEEIQIPNHWLPHLNDLTSLSLTRCWSDKLKSLHFRKLKWLTLSQLSCSTIFSFLDFERLQELRELQITNCASLEEIVEVVTGDEASGVDRETVALVQLKSVILHGLPKLKSFMKSKNLIRGLEEVEVEPSILFTCSVFRILKQLEKLRVTDCRLLESIAEVARGYETSSMYEMGIIFPKLSVIGLRDLPNLQNFSPAANYSFKMPKLNYFHLVRCPRVENKTSMRIIAEHVYVYSDEDPQGIYVENLTDYIRQRHIRSINNLESVGQSSYSNQDVETETVRVEEEDEKVVEQGEEGLVVQEEKQIQQETTPESRRRKVVIQLFLIIIVSTLFFFLKKV